MRMRGAASASARSSESEAILLTCTRVRPPRVSTKSGSTPNWVIVGPRLISTTCAGAPKDASVSSIRWARCLMKSSLMAGALPASSTSRTCGSVQWISAAPTVVTGAGTVPGGKLGGGGGKLPLP